MKFLILTCCLLLPAFSLAVLHCQFYSAPSYSERKFHTELGSLIKSTWNDLQLLLISTTAETLLNSLPRRIDHGKCKLSGVSFLHTVNPTAVQELQNRVPLGAASSVGHWLCHRAAWSWDSAAPLLLYHYSAIFASCQWYSSMLPGTECKTRDNAAEDCHWCFPLRRSWMSADALVLFPPSSFKIRSYLASCRIAPNKSSLSSFNTAITDSCCT